jgi:heme oxygenase
VESSETSAKSSSILEDLKNAAMHLHTKDQAANGGQEAKKERPEFVPTREGYLRYLMDSREIFSTLEEIVNANPKLSKLKANGLERTGALDKDIAMLSGMGIQPFGYEEGETSPGTEYVKHLKEMSEKNLPGFMCHYYNTYFAHTAGGRMIGKAVADKILDGAKLDFYHDYPEKNVKKLSAPVKDLIEDIALDWSQEERDQCTGQTPKAFQFAGQVMRQITASSSSK